MQTSVNTTLRLLFARQAKGKRKLVLRRVESRTGAVALASRWLLGCFRRARLNPVWRNSVSCSRSSNRTGRFPASGSRKRHTMFRVTPSATSEHNLGWLDSIVNPHVLCCLLRPSLTEAPSLRRSYPASAVLRTSPPPHTARPVSRELPVDPDRDHRWGFPCCVWSPMHTCHRHYPGRSDEACPLAYLHRRRPSLCNSQVGSCNCFFGACSAFTHVMACTLAESPSDPFHRELRPLRCLRRRLDCYRVERTSSRAGVAPAEVQRLSRRTATPTTDPFPRHLRPLRCLRRRLDCFRVERTSSRAGVAPAEVQRLSRRTATPTILAAADTWAKYVNSGTAQPADP